MNYDSVVIGLGPNGLSAAVELTRNGAKTLVVGGKITGNAADMTQPFTRPVARISPYSTPSPKLFICSHSSPPGGGVHGMCGYYAAQSALKQL